MIANSCKLRSKVVSLLHTPSSLFVKQLPQLPQHTNFIRYVHSRRQLKRLAPGHGGLIDLRVKRSRGIKPATVPALDSSEELDEVRSNFHQLIINKDANTNMEKLGNGFVMPPPKTADFTPDDAPTFRVTRTAKEKGLGFYPVYTSYRNSGSRVFTTVKVSGNVLDFVAALHTMVVLPSGVEEGGGDLQKRLKDKMGKEDFLEDVRPAAGNGGDSQWKVTINGRWKREIEELLWGMGM